MSINKNTYPRKKDGYTPDTAPLVLERKTIYEKIDVTGKTGTIDPTEWQTYFAIEGPPSRPFSDQEQAILQAYFLALGDTAAQEKIINKLGFAYYFLWNQAAYGQPNPPRGKAAGITRDQKVFSPAKGEFLRFDYYISRSSTQGINGSVVQELADCARGDYLPQGPKAKLSTVITAKWLNDVLAFAQKTGNTSFAGNIQTLLDSNNQLLSGVGGIQSAVNSLATGISGISADVISTKDLLKTRTQLFTPEQLKDPKIKKQLEELAASEAALEEEKRKQAQILNSELRREGVFDPLVGSLADPDLPQQQAHMDSFAKTMMQGKSFNGSKFDGPRIKSTDANLNSPLYAIKRDQELANYAEAEKKKLGRPKGSIKSGKLNMYLEQRSINRIKTFMNSLDPPKEFKKVDQPKENFKYLDPNLSYLPADYSEKYKSFSNLDPEVSKDDKIELMRLMMFDAYK